jgi:hypothetical protein
MNTPATITVSIEVPVDEDWIKFCTKHNDIFMTGYCGYWAFGVFIDEAGWLVFDRGDERSPSDKACNAAVAAYDAKQPLPENWYLLDREMAIKAFAAGVKRRGVDWYENGDATDYDVAIQTAIFGEPKYG